MKVLRKKLKKVHIVKKILYFLTLLAYIGTLSYFIYGLLQLKGIETVLRIIVITFFIIWGIVYLFGGLICMISKKTKLLIFLTIVSILLCPLFGVSSYYINKVYGALDKMVQETKTYTTNLIALKETNFNEKSVIGMIGIEDDIEGNKLAKKLINKEKLTNKIKTYEDYNSMISDLYKDKIDACFVTSNFAIVFGNTNFEKADGEQEVPISERVKVLYSYEEDMDNADTAILNTENNKVKTLTEPFTMLIMGVDSEIDGLKANQAFNGDTLILITFNPKTLTATMLSIPRDMYVPIACNHNRYNKINSSAAYGSSCVINTVQKLTDVKIDYYLKMNFTGVVQLVDALGGVTVNVEKPNFFYDKQHANQVCEQDSKRRFGSNLVCMDTGVQNLNGEQALAYARCRHLYATSDIARNQHQQEIIEAIAQKIKGIRSINDFEKILNTVSNNVETNMKPEQILSFYNVAKDMLANSNEDSKALSIKKTFLQYHNLRVYIPSADYYASALGYYPESLNAIKKLMKVNLGQETEKPIKTFAISYNENYTTPLVGQNLYGGETLKTMPNYFGFDKEYVRTWCSNVGRSCSFEAVKNPAEYGQIVNQSVHEGVLLNSISGTITFHYSDNKNGTIKPKPDTDNEDDEEENNDEENEDNKKPGNNNEDEENNEGNKNNEDNEDNEDNESDEPSQGDNNSSNDEPNTNTDTDILLPDEN